MRFFEGSAHTRTRIAPRCTLLAVILSLACPHTKTRSVSFPTQIDVRAMLTTPPMGGATITVSMRFLLDYRYRYHGSDNIAITVYRYLDTDVDSIFSDLSL